MPRIVILGTGTDVGKTYVTAQLAAALRALAADDIVTAIKPVESGTGHTTQWDGSSDPVVPTSAHQSGPPASDGEALAGASSMPRFVAEHAYQFADPISPHLAARKSNCAIDPRRIVRWVEACARSRETQRPPSSSPSSLPSLSQSSSPQLLSRQHWVLVETAGATHSPLGPSLINADLATLLEPAIWLLVAPDRLGVLHDVTTTLSALKVTHRVPDLIVLSQPPVHDRSTGTNGPELGLLGIAEIAGVVSSNGSVSPPIVERLHAIAHARDL